MVWLSGMVWLNAEGCSFIIMYQMDPLLPIAVQELSTICFEPIYCGLILFSSRTNTQLHAYYQNI